MSQSLQLQTSPKSTDPLSELRQRYAEPSLNLPWQQDIIALRRDFHAHPELGYEETRSAGVVAARLRELGLTVQEGLGVTGVKGVLRNGDGPVILVRADMDALPVEEQNDWEWKSEISGKMHACGHDAHMAIGLSVARLLAESRDEWSGTVVFMFQPAEEGGNGAGRMIDDGLLNDPAPDLAFALHVWSDVEVGKVAVSPGPAMASADMFKARIFGRGGHGAMPHQTVDPVVVAAHMVTALQTIVARNIDPLQPCVITVGRIQAGNAGNVIPDEAILEGTFRAFDPQVREELMRRIEEMFKTLPPVFGATGACFFHPPTPATINDEGATEIARQGIENAVGAENVMPWTPLMGAEDMSMVLERVPGCYFFVGGRNENIGANYPHHHPKFNIDERALEIGARTMVSVVRHALTQ